MKLLFAKISWKMISAPALGLVLAASAQAATTVGGASLDGGVPAANARSGHPDTILPQRFDLALIAQGIDPLENPSGLLTHFGYLGDADTQPVEPTKTEPDQNVFLVLDHNPGGPEVGYDYGRHFVFQGHENGNDLAYITRINLDVANPDHHITLLTPVGADNKTHFNSIDGATWDPFTKTLLFSQEAGTNGGVVELSPEFATATPRTLYGSVGRGSYEGIRVDDQGSIFIVEDAGGTGVNVDPANPASPKSAKIPNSYVYRFVPKNKSDLSQGGVLQALQVSINGTPLVYVPVDASHPTGDAFSAAQLSLHTPGTSWPAKWITIHDTAVDGFADFGANALARAAGATPFKRPENGAFQPGSGFRSFFFTVTGDTDTNSGNVPDLAARGAWGSVFRLDLDSSRNNGWVSIVVLGDAVHAGFDNIAFASRNVLLVGEDRGDTLHKELNALDSVWAFSLKKNGGASAERFIALGRDKASEADVALAGTPGFQNEGDNEPTGVFVSDGAASIRGLLGANDGDADDVERSSIFFTQQHGENNVYLVIPDRSREHGRDREHGHDHD